jgi:hypothetical protein
MERAGVPNVLYTHCIIAVIYRINSLKMRLTFLHEDLFLEALLKGKLLI